MDKSQNTGPATPSLNSLSKRQKVAKANKSIFIWVAIAAAVVALCLVLLQFLVQAGLYNNKIIGAKSEANKTLAQNIENAKELKKNVDALIADENLGKVRADEGDANLRVILDALPTTGDTTTLSNSLVSRIVGPVGIKIESVTAGAIDGVTVPTDPIVAASGSVEPQPLAFTIGVIGDASATKNALLNLEKTIRPMNVTVLDIKNSSGTLTTTITGETYYLSAAKIERQTKAINP